MVSKIENPFGVEKFRFGGKKIIDCFEKEREIGTPNLDMISLEVVLGLFRNLAVIAFSLILSKFSQWLERRRMGHWQWGPILGPPHHRFGLRI